MIDRPLLLVIAATLVVSSLVAFAVPAPGDEISATPSAASARPDAEWRRDAVWDDGLAEFAVYDLTWPRYGRERQGSALLVLAKEPWNATAEVKADDASRADFDVIKLNHVLSARTGIYRYEQMASVFLRRNDGGLQKITAASAEACGLTTARMTKGKLRVESYFESEGDRAMAWPERAWPEDGLPALLRDFVTGEMPSRLKIFPSLLHGRHPSLRAEDWKLNRESSAKSVTLTLAKGSARSVLTFAAARPHHLVSWDKSDGTRYRLRKVERLAYWNMNGPKGEAWWPESLLTGR